MKFKIGEADVRLQNVPSQKCASCGAVYTAGPVIEKVEAFVASRLPEAGVETGAAFKFMRKALGLKASEVADLLDVRPETVSRWENGETPDKMRLATLAEIASETLEGRTRLLGRLKTMAAHRRETRRHGSQSISLDFAAAAG